MKKHLLFLFIAILSINSYSQIKFEKGYFVYDADLKVECFIKNIDWSNNPTEFEYKLLDDSEEKIASINAVKEFGIYNVSKYIKSKVKIDRSSGNINDLTNDKSPVLKEETLFLKVLIEGKANLYSYEDGNLIRYFFNTETSNIEQLIYKKYKNHENDTKKNNQFKQQLWSVFKCEEITLDGIERLKYNRSSLVKLFTEYNTCKNSNYKNYTSVEKKDLFNFTLRPRLNNSKLSIYESGVRTTGFPFPTSVTHEYDNQTSFGFGLEAEYILPINKNKWAIVIEAAYQNFKGETTTKDEDLVDGESQSKVDYSSVEVPISLRHYFFINDNSKIFVNASYVIDFNSKSTIVFKRSNGDTLKSLEINSNPNLAIGIGYKAYDKYSFEIRYQTNREILRDYVYSNSDYNSLSFIIGYSLF